ncbi:DUF4936 family protein [Ampullimonas aquatilis]|uniref:DUF4936 family protein n=1 Tax=Ampullimonas aquatilis TaxID=1341549 RepID=UPI003C74B2EF
MRHLYIYYKTRPELADTVQTAFAQLVNLLNHRGRLMRRPASPDATDNLVTWMEVFENLPDDFEARLKQALIQTGFAYRVASPRHTEAFIETNALEALRTACA